MMLSAQWKFTLTLLSVVATATCGSLPALGIEPMLPTAVTKTTPRATDPPLSVLKCKFDAALSAYAANPAITVAFYPAGNVSVPEFSLYGAHYDPDQSDLLYIWSIPDDKKIPSTVVLSRSSMVLTVNSPQKGTVAWDCQQSSSRFAVAQ